MRGHDIVIGGGFVGQLVQLAIPSVRILDWRKTAPENHLETRMGPQYLWEPIPGVPSTSFPVTTLVDGFPPTPESILRYKKKIGKETDGGNWGLQFRHQSTGWSSQLPVPRVEYNRHVTSVDLVEHKLLMADNAVIAYDLLVNTIPLPFFLKLCTIAPLVYSPFNHDPIYMAVKDVDEPVEGMILNYISEPTSYWYRETLSGRHQYLESLLGSLGTISATKIMPGKIHVNPESEEVIYKLRQFDVWCFGRFATWRPDELGHETWEQIALWKELV